MQETRRSFNSETFAVWENTYLPHLAREFQEVCTLNALGVISAWAMCDSIAAQSLVKTTAAVVTMARAVAEVASLECHMPLEFTMETHVGRRQAVGIFALEKQIKKWLPRFAVKNMLLHQS